MSKVPTNQDVNFFNSFGSSRIIVGRLISLIGVDMLITGRVGWIWPFWKPRHAEGLCECRRGGHLPVKAICSAFAGKRKGCCVVDIQDSIDTTFEIYLQAFKKADSFGSFLLKKRTPTQIQEALISLYKPNDYRISTTRWQQTPPWTTPLTI